MTSVGNPAASLSENGALPAGVTLTDNGDGTATLLGHPGRGNRRRLPDHDHGDQRVSPDATQAFTLTVDQAPTITSAAKHHLHGRQRGSFTVTSVGIPPPASARTGPCPPG